MALKGTGKRTISRNMEKRTAFEHGRAPDGSPTVSGKWYDSFRDVPLGKIPFDVTREDDQRGPVFVIFSYRTPIAWTYDRHDGKVWMIPEVRYSVTTTNHQSIVRVCADNPGFYNDTRW